MSRSQQVACKVCVERRMRTRSNHVPFPCSHIRSSCRGLPSRHHVVARQMHWHPDVQCRHPLCNQTRRHRHHDCNELHIRFCGPLSHPLVHISRLCKGTHQSTYHVLPHRHSHGNPHACCEGYRYLVYRSAHRCSLRVHGTCHMPRRDILTKDRCTLLAPGRHLSTQRVASLFP